MTSKRALYKPIEKESVEIKNKRAPLTQGRLVSKGPVKTGNNGMGKLVPGQPIDVQPSSLFSSGSQRGQGYHQQVRSSSFVSNDNSLSPRRDPPSVSFEHSPKQYRPRPTMALDLSDDSDNDRANDQDGVAAMTAGVMMVDASRQTKSLDESEVDITLGVIKSPYKVVCHSTRAVHSDLRNTGDVETARRVTVDRVPTVNIIRETSQQATLPTETHDKGGHVPAHEVSDSSLSSITSLVSEPDATAVTREKKKADLKKKKGGRIVASRYMKAAPVEKSKGPMKATDRTILTKASGLLGKSVVTKPKAKGITPSKRLASTGGSGKKINRSAPLLTPANQPHTPTAGTKTSTPCADGSLFQTPDASAIMSTEPSAFGYDIDDSLNPTRVRPAGRHQSAKKHYDTGTPENFSQARASGITQQELDMLYNRYLQWLYLDVRAERAFKEQEKYVMPLFKGIADETDKLRKRRADLDIQLAKLKHANKLDKALDIQIDGLGPVVSSLPGIKDPYHSLAEALDTTRHQIQTKTINVPDDEESYIAACTAALNESERLLGELSVMCRQKEPKVTTCATALEMLKDTVQKEAKEVNSCQEMLAALESLAMAETSLQIQAQQLEN